MLDDIPNIGQKPQEGIDETIPVIGCDQRGNGGAIEKYTMNEKAAESVYQFFHGQN
ncbi:MAG: hypothetical protein V8R80_07880 [Eubacterium sp.]